MWCINKLFALLVLGIFLSGLLFLNGAVTLPLGEKDSKEFILIIQNFLASQRQYGK